MEAELVHGEGDLEGQPFRLAGHMLRVLYRWFEYDVEAVVGQGAFYAHKEGLIGWPKGQAKTEFEQATGLEHILGPSIVTGTPVVLVGAVDSDQASELVRRAGMMVRGQPVADRLGIIGDTKIQLRDSAARMVSTTAALGKNDGKLPTLQLNDELHEWDGPGTAGGARRYGILERALNKRPQARQLNVTTAGWSLESLLGGLYIYGKQVADKEVADPAFLMDWWEASAHWDLEDQVQLLCAIREANPAADVFWDAEQLVRGYNKHKTRGILHEYVRYHLNRWFQDPELLWMDMAAHAARAKPGQLPPPGTAVVLGFDGSRHKDSTAIVGATVAVRPHVFVVECWERPRDAGDDWEVPEAAVRARLMQACEYWNVVEVAADVALWRETLQNLEMRGLPLLEFPQTSKRMAPACEAFIESTNRGLHTHDADPRLTRHIGNAHRFETTEGVRIAKAHKKSERRIDLAVAAVMARDRASFLAREEKAKGPAIHAFADDDPELLALIAELEGEYDK
jgi:phage terminase large subunit-like protein